MDRSRMLFCPDLGDKLTTQEMSTFLAGNVFGDPGFKDLLKARYDQMGRLFRDAHFDDPCWNLKEPFSDCKNKPDPAKRDARLVVPRSRLAHAPQNVTGLFDYDNFGHDMPVWVTYNNDPKAKRVMIVSQDPLRSGDITGNLYLSTPFGIHSRDFEKGGMAHMEPRIGDMLNAFLSEGFCVYLTDYMKFYATILCENENIRKIVQEDVEHDKNGYKDLFSKAIDSEIEKFDPQLIITLGDRTRGAEWTNSILSTVQSPQCGVDLRPLQGGQGRMTMTLVHPSNANIHLVRLGLTVPGPGCVIRYYDEAIAKAVNALRLLN